MTDFGSDAPCSEREQLVPAAQRNLLRARAEASDLRPLLALSTDSVYKMALRWPQVSALLPKKLDAQRIVFSAVVGWHTFVSQ